MASGSPGTPLGPSSGVRPAPPGLAVLRDGQADPGKGAQPAAPPAVAGVVEVPAPGGDPHHAGRTHAAGVEAARAADVEQGAVALPGVRVAGFGDGRRRQADAAPALRVGPGVVEPVRLAVAEDEGIHRAAGVEAAGRTGGQHRISRLRSHHRPRVRRSVVVGGGFVTGGIVDNRRSATIRRPVAARRRSVERAEERRAGAGGGGRRAPGQRLRRALDSLAGQVDLTAICDLDPGSSPAGRRPAPPCAASPATRTCSPPASPTPSSWRRRWPCTRRQAVACSTPGRTSSPR